MKTCLDRCWGSCSVLGQIVTVFHVKAVAGSGVLQESLTWFWNQLMEVASLPQETDPEQTRRVLGGCWFSSQSAVGR